MKGPVLWLSFPLPVGKLQVVSEKLIPYSVSFFDMKCWPLPPIPGLLFVFSEALDNCAHIRPSVLFSLAFLFELDLSKLFPRPFIYGPTEEDR